MVDIIHNAFRPLALVAFILGLGNFRYPLSYWKFRLSVFYIIIVWSFYACAFHVMISKFSPMRIFSNPLTFISISTNILVTIISVTITVRKQKKIHICLKKLCLVDDTLEKLGTPKEYHTIKKLIRLMFIIYLIMILILFTTDSIWNIERHNSIKAVIIGLIVGYPFHINTLGDIMIAFVLRHLHSELCRIARDMNDLFGTQFILQMIGYFIILVTTFFVQFHMILCLTHVYVTDSSALKLILSTDMWCMVFLTKFISLNYICESVCAKVQKTKALTHKLTDLIRFTETRKEIYQFLLQMSLRPLEFRGMGVIHFGYKFINKFFIWVLSVIIFILQMDTPPMYELLKSNGINETSHEIAKVTIMIVQDSIEKALNPVFLITFFWGLGILKYSSNQLKYCLSLFYIFTVWSVYTYALYYTIDLFSIKTVFNNLINTLVVILNLFVALISITISICKHKAQKTKEVIHKLTNFNSFAEVHEEIYQFVLQMSLRPLKFSGMGLFYFGYDFIHIRCQFSIGTIMMNMVNSIEQAIRSLFWIYHVLGLYSKSYLITIMVDTIQKAFRPLALVAFVLGFGNLIIRYPINYWRFRLSIFYTIIVWSFYAFAFHFMMHKFSPSRIFNNHLTFLSVNINIFVTITSVSITVRKHQAQKTKILTHKLTDLIRFTEMRKEIYQFLLQMSLRPLEFRGMGVIHFGYKFINKVNFYEL
ncbi:hypothetical protein ALC60_03272 [Trachymyrmex zeteki]|uniref:Gustatory receptor n=1 Tax=Mycetomoellerius zeteki TaxID=64791 RepID=A0A151XBQ8_9HYME|nr:hypothetical protein ALC60_03272 [Trachymyrmex zeteki]